VKYVLNDFTTSLLEHFSAVMAIAVVLHLYTKTCLALLTVAGVNWNADCTGSQSQMGNL